MLKKIIKLHSEEKGNALLISFAILAALSLILIVYMNRAVTETQMSSKSKQITEVFNSAEAGLNDVLWRLNNINDWTSNTFPMTLINKESNNRIYQVTVEANGAIYTATSTGGYPVLNEYNQWVVDMGKPTTTLRSRMRLANFADYSRFVDGNINYGAGAVLQGKLHANGNINFGSTNIICKSDVTATGSFTGSTPDFQAGHKSGVASRTLPQSTLDLRALARGEVAGRGKGLYFNSSRTIDLADLASLLPDDSTPPVTTLPSNFNGVVYVDNGNAVVSGTPSRGLTISADGDITISDNIGYPQDADGNILNETIGLVARSQILIDDDLDGNRNSELVIDAALMGLNLDVNNNPTSDTGWQALGNNSGYTLTINGSIITANGGSSGGYSTRNYNWDEKYAINTPPFFPAEIGGNFERIFWEQL